MPETFTAALAVDLSGFDRSYARVLLLEQADGLAIAVIDTNGDSREVEANLYGVDPSGRWRELASGLGSGADEDAVWQCGYAPSLSSVQVRYAGRTHVVPVVAETGMWYFAARRDAGDALGEARLPEGPPNEPWR